MLSFMHLQHAVDYQRNKFWLVPSFEVEGLNIATVTSIVRESKLFSVVITNAKLAWMFLREHVLYL